MKKILSLFAIVSFSSIFAQVTINNNLASSISIETPVESEIKINKGAIGNFAKYQMDVPTGFAVTAIDVKGGNFTFENQRAKIVWVSVPSETEFSIKLKIQANKNVISPATISQKYFYLENNEKKEIEASPIVVTIVGNEVSSAVAKTEAKIADIKPTEPIVKTEPVVEKVVEPKKEVEVAVEKEVVETKPVEPAVVVNETVSKPVKEESKPIETVKPEPKTTSSAEKGINYRVQIGAYGVQPLKAKFSELKNVNIDLVNGMYKVTVGKFNTKEEAVQYKESIVAKGYKGFVVTYNGNNRVN
jgi:cell division protein FtsN